MLEDLTSSALTDQSSTIAHPPTDQEDWHRAAVESTPGDSRLWAEILRNLSKDVSKHNNILLSESSLASVTQQQQQQQQQQQTSSEKPLRAAMMIAFSCGHVFPGSTFYSKVLLDFAERLQDFPVPIPCTTSFLQQYYRQPGSYACACPYCVFQYLRKGQLEQCTNVPIRPWNP